jgi:hypothetical protein
MTKQSTWQRRVLRGVIIYGVVPYLSVVLIFAILQRQLMYRPTPSSNLNVGDLKLNPEAFLDVQLRTSDDETLRGWLLTGKRLDGDELKTMERGLVIYFPGNSLNRSERIQDLREVADFGYDVLVFDYRGYGDSTGNPPNPL